jgi:hypothetical protein
LPAQVEKELSEICSSILQLLDEHLIPTASSGESKVFYLKMKVRHVATTRRGSLLAGQRACMLQSSATRCLLLCEGVRAQLK